MESTFTPQVTIKKVKCKCGRTFRYVRKHQGDVRSYCTRCRPTNIRGRGGRDYVRSLVRLRDNYTCQNPECAKQLTPAMLARRNKGIDNPFKKHRLFDVHHLNGQCGKNSRGYDRIEDMDGLITLCHPCHFKRHDFQPRLKKAAILAV